jgi:hypothetical protein
MQVKYNLIGIFMGWKGTLKAMQAAERRQQRDAQKRLRELERQSKEQAKLSAIEQARLEVETYENGLGVLLSVHKEQGEVWDWLELAAALPPHKPTKFRRHEFKARQHSELIRLLGNYQESGTSIEDARVKDEQEFQEASQTYENDLAEWDKMKSLARRILAGEHSAYTEALVQFSGLAEISDLGSSIHFTIHSLKLVECGLNVNGLQSIPADQKTLTAAGKLSVKPMPKARFHEIYQDYVCGCVLRVAREIFALLPIEMVLVTASVDMVDSKSGQTIAQPVLSVAIDRAEIRQFVFEHLDPSDAIETLRHRGDAKASRKSGEFEIIPPLTPDDLPQSEPGDSADYHDLNARVRQMRDAIKTESEQSNPPPQTPAPELMEQL